jgi:hypothetical protein
MNSLGRGVTAWNQQQLAEERLGLQREKAGREEEMFPLEKENIQARTGAYERQGTGQSGGGALDLRTDQADAMAAALAMGATDPEDLEKKISKRLGEIPRDPLLVPGEVDPNEGLNRLRAFMTDPAFSGLLFSGDQPQPQAPQSSRDPGWQRREAEANMQRAIENSQAERSQPVTQNQDFQGMLQTGQPQGPAPIDRKTFMQSQFMGGGTYPAQQGAPGPGGPQAPVPQGPGINYPDTQASLQLPGQQQGEPIDQFMAGLPQGPQATPADRSALGEFGRLWQTVMNPASPEEALLAAWSRLQDFRVQPPQWVNMRLQGAGGGMPA